MNKQKIRRLRLWSIGTITTLVVVGGIAGIGTGSLSAFGLKTIYAVCPVGYLEVALASRDILPRLLICFAVIVGLTILLGRIFCGWACPVPLFRKIFTNKVDEPNDAFQRNIKGPQEHQVHQDKDHDGEVRLALEDGEPRKASISQDHSTVKNNKSYGLPVLGAALASSAIFGFPVFCLICPIGLIFATIFALTRLLNFNEPTLDLIIFPLIIIVELVFLKKWCSKICPLGALLGLISRLNRRLVPTVDRSRCLEETHGTKCQQCRKACSYDIDIKNGKGTGHISSCTKCKECATSCPVHAISFPWKKATKEGTISEKRE
jgi:ferredoxin-type protein NapH